jgi:hypothetical protein
MHSIKRADDFPLRGVPLIVLSAEEIDQLHPNGYSPTIQLLILPSSQNVLPDRSYVTSENLGTIGQQSLDNKLLE